MLTVSGAISKARRFLSGLVLPTVTEFPEDPTVGRLVMRNEVMYICRIHDGEPGWHPVINTRITKRFVIDVAARNWTVRHNLGPYVMVTAYRPNNKTLRVRKVVNVPDSGLSDYELKVDVGTTTKGTLQVVAIDSLNADLEVVPIELVAGPVASLANYASMEVDRQAEAQRLRVLTPGDGQALEYANTAKELDKFLNDADPKEADYPYLAADVGILGKDISEVAATVKAIDTQWTAVGAKIKKVRRQAKNDIKVAEAAGDEQAIRDATNINWDQVYL